MARTHENKQFPSFCTSCWLRASTEKRLRKWEECNRVFRFLSRALIWPVWFCLLIKCVCLFYLFLEGLFEQQTMTCCLVIIPTPTSHKVALTLNKQLGVHKTFFPLHTAMSMLMYHGAMKRRKWEGRHKSVWCMQGLMESTFASTLGTKQERWEGERHPSETERSCPNGEGK